MIDIASQATQKVLIPNRHKTRRQILKLFKNEMQIIVTSSRIDVSESLHLQYHPT